MYHGLFEGSVIASLFLFLFIHNMALLQRLVAITAGVVLSLESISLPSIINDVVVRYIEMMTATS